MKKSAIAVLTATAVVVAIPITVARTSAASAVGARHHAGSVTIRSWLYVAPSENVLSGTVWDCFTISGAIADRGGDPQWSDAASYTAPNALASGGVTAASHECGDKVPAGGFILVPPPESGQYQFAGYTTPVDPEGATTTSPGGLSTLYATHTISGRRGDIFISFSGTYNMTNAVVPVKLPSGATDDVKPLTTGPQCTWLITGGTNAYAGLQGSGTCSANAENTFPYINHTEQGDVWWSGS